MLFCPELPLGALNLTDGVIGDFLINNRIPPAWMDHAYIFSLHYLNHHFGSSLHADFFNTINKERLCRLDQYGELAAMANKSINGWRELTDSDIARIQSLLYMEERGRRTPIFSLKHGLWLRLGKTGLFRDLQAFAWMEHPVSTHKMGSTELPNAPLQASQPALDTPDMPAPAGAETPHIATEDAAMAPPQRCCKESQVQQQRSMRDAKQPM